MQSNPIPEKAIKLAADAGWDGAMSWPWQRIALDPSFFQALGKALGWDESDAQKYEMYKMSGGAGNMPVGIYMWHKNAIRFYDLILTGGSTDEFWDDLLK